jgi:hypothetical protein
MTDGTMQHLLAPITQRQLDTGMNPGPVKGFHAAPHGFRNLWGQVDPFRVLRGSVPEGDRVQVPGNGAEVQGAASQ